MRGREFSDRYKIKTQWHRSNLQAMTTKQVSSLEIEGLKVRRIAAETGKLPLTGKRLPAIQSSALDTQWDKRVT